MVETVSAGAQGQPTKGTLMDIACSSHHATEAGYTESHDKKCLVMESCVKSGYSLVTADKKVAEVRQEEARSRSGPDQEG